MQELRFVAVSEDGSYAVLAVPGRSGRYILPIDERLRAVALGQTSRLAQYEIEVESPLRPKEIQARIRAGETAEEIADAAGIPVERVRWFEGPVLAERAYIADQAQAGSVRRAGDSSGPGPRLGDIVTARLTAAGTDPADGQWDSRKRGDGNWQVSLTFPSGGRLHVAEWVFDPRRRHVMPDDDNAARLSLPESELPPEPVSVPGEATVTPIASRLGAAAGMGGGAYRRPRRVPLPPGPLCPPRPVPRRGPLAGRPAGRRLPPRLTPATPAASAQERHAAAERPPAPPAPSRHASPDRPDYQDHRGGGYAEFPESAPYRFAEPAPEPTARPDLAQEPSAYRPPAESHGQPVAGPAAATTTRLRLPTARRPTSPATARPPPSHGPTRSPPPTATRSPGRPPPTTRSLGRPRTTRRRRRLRRPRRPRRLPLRRARWRPRRPPPALPSSRIQNEGGRLPRAQSSSRTLSQPSPASSLGLARPPPVPRRRRSLGHPRLGRNWEQRRRQSPSPPRCPRQ